MSTPATVTAGRGVTGPVLVGAAFALTTLLNLGSEVGGIIFSDRDPYRAEGPVDSIQAIALYGGIGLALALAVALPMTRDPDRAKVGAIILGALSLLTIVFFWSGAPATLGAAAAWSAGLTKGATPQSGVARAFGVVGFVIAALVVVVTLVGHVATLAGALA